MGPHVDSSRKRKGPRRGDTTLGLSLFLCMCVRISSMLRELQPARCMEAYVAGLDSVIVCGDVPERLGPSVALGDWGGQ